jgi:SEL1 protein
MKLKGWGTAKDAQGAMTLFQKASEGGNILASYNLAALLLSSSENCDRAANLLKNVAERGWGSLSEATADFDAGDYGWALYNYLRVADVGVELAQHNAAWMMSNGYGYEGPGVEELGTRLYKLSAVQGGVDALVPLGDAYWYGKGLDIDLKKAGKMYTSASPQIPRASFNLGYMHQYGLGLPKDFHLSKRYYDQAMNGGRGAFLSAALALMWLKVHQFWDSVAKSALPGFLVVMLEPLFESSEESLVSTMQGSISGTSQGEMKAAGLSMILDTLEHAVDSTLFVWLAALVAIIVSKMLMTRDR